MNIFNYGLKGRNSMKKKEEKKVRKIKKVVKKSPLDERVLKAFQQVIYTRLVLEDVLSEIKDLEYSYKLELQGAVND